MTPTRLLTFDLGEFGRVVVHEDIDPETGTVRFHVYGRRVSGVFVFRPDAEPDQPIPQRLSIAYGDQQRSDRPTFNGVELDGGATLDPHDSGPLRWRLNLRRPDTTWHHHTRFPDRSAEYATSVIAALVDRWRHHPHHDDLVMAAARRSAQQRIDDLLRSEIQPRWAQIAEISAAINRAYALVEQLRQLT